MQSYSSDELSRFVEESNRIEGIHRKPTEDELRATCDFIELSVVQILDMERLVEVYASGARLREKADMDVQVGRHQPQPGGLMVRHMLKGILTRIGNEPFPTPYRMHVAYETLHPFMDGNGRSGRALWAWQMIQQPDNRIGLGLGFLHAFYYQALAAASVRL